MKKKLLSIVSILLCFALLVSGASVASYAVEEQNVTVSQEESAGDTIMKGLYNTLNVIVEGLVKMVSIAIYSTTSNPVAVHCAIRQHAPSSVITVSALTIYDSSPFV